MSEKSYPTLDNTIRELGRFGYDADEHQPDWPGEWERLKNDFTTKRRPWVPRFDQMDEAQTAAAEEYMSRRIQADALFAKCEALHRQILEGGINVAITEDYTVARDAYEDMVESFGAAREALDALLPNA
jgi:hypothetical protein